MPGWGARDVTTFVVECFSCSGGMAEGFRRAGLPVSMAFDYDEDACASYLANHGHAPIRMDVRDLLRMATDGWRPSRVVDLFVADPPCTPWSMAGKRLGQADERDMLQTTADLIALLKPRAYLIGNVPGLDTEPNWPVVQRVLAPLHRYGYCVEHYSSFDAADFGVPQHRVRPFWFGHLADVGCIRWPEPTHCNPEDLGAHLPGVEVLRPWVTVRQALGHLSAEDLGRPIRTRWKPTDDHRQTEPDEPAKSLTTKTPSDGALLTLNRKHRINTPDAPSYVVTAKGDCRGAQGACALEWPYDRPSTVVLCGNGTGEMLPPGKGSLFGSRRANAIVISEKAGTILQGFPETWKFTGSSKATRWSQIGQAMPPPLAEAVARSVAATLRSAAP